MVDSGISTAYQRMRAAVGARSRYGAIVTAVFQPAEPTESTGIKSAGSGHHSDSQSPRTAVGDFIHGIGSQRVTVEGVDSILALPESGHCRVLFGQGLPGMTSGPTLTAPMGSQDPSARYMRPTVIPPLFCDPAINIPC